MSRMEEKLTLKDCKNNLISIDIGTGDVVSAFIENMETILEHMKCSRCGKESSFIMLGDFGKGVHTEFVIVRDYSFIPYWMHTQMPRLVVIRSDKTFFHVPKSLCGLHSHEGISISWEDEFNRIESGRFRKTMEALRIIESLI